MTPELIGEAERAFQFAMWNPFTTRGPSPHLSWKELACTDGTPYPSDQNLVVRNLAAEFEFVRALLGGKPIPVSSAFRTPSFNRQVGGKPNSQHLFGRALDMHHPSPQELLDACLYRAKEYRDSRIRGLGLYPWGVHLDIRTALRLARWRAPEMRG